MSNLTDDYYKLHDELERKDAAFMELCDALSKHCEGDSPTEWVASIEAKDAEIERLEAENERLHGEVAILREQVKVADSEHELCEAENAKLRAVYEAAKGVSWPGPMLEKTLAELE